MKKIYFNLITLLALSFAILSCGEETEIPNDIVEENEIAEEEIVKNDIIFEPFEVVGRSIDVEFDGKHLWVAHYEDSKISKLDVDGNVLKVVDVEGEPIKITYDGEFLWVAHFTEPIVSKLSTDGEIIGVYDTGESPGGIFRNGDEIWVANGMSNFISKISRDTGETLAEYPIGGGEMPGPYAMEFDGKNLWVANYFENTLERLNLNGEVIQTINPGFDPVSIVYDGKNLWVVLVDEDSIALIDDEGEIESTHPVPNGPREVIYDGKNLWVVSFDEKKISRLDLEGKVEGELSLGGGPWAISHDGENIWVADSTQPKIWKVSNIYGDMEEPKPIKEKYFDLDEIDSLPNIISTEEGFFSSPVPSLVIDDVIWLSIKNEQRIVIINRSGEELKSIKIEGELSDMIYDGNFVWVSDPKERSISKYTKDGGFVSEFEVSSRPTKMTMVF